MTWLQERIEDEHRHDGEPADLDDANRPSPWDERDRG